MALDRVPGQCFAFDCPAGAKPNQLMCWGHWRRVPRGVQAAIWASNYLAHPEYEPSRLAAQAALAAKAGRALTAEQVELLDTYGIGPDGYPQAGR